MGVEGLWSLIESCSQPVHAQSLRGKVLAVDVSIWLHQSLKGYRDKNGQPLPNAHLLGLFHRVAKLLHYGIRPVFVFDGGVPPLKRQTLSRRKQLKNTAVTKAQVARTKLLRNFLQTELERAKNKNLPSSLKTRPKVSSPSPSKSPKVEENDLLGLGFLETPSSDEEEEWVEVDEEEESGNNRNYDDDFGIMNSPRFDTLPLETQHEILFEMQESKKNNSWKKMDKMPKDPFQFSSFQVNRLLKRRFLQKKILAVQKEMGQRHIHVQNLEDELASYETEEQIQSSCDSNVPRPNTPIASTSKTGASASSKVSFKSKFDDSDYVDFSVGSEDEAIMLSSAMKNEDEDAQLQLAIELSLSSSFTQVTKPKSLLNSPQWIQNEDSEKKIIEEEIITSNISSTSRSLRSPRRSSIKMSLVKSKRVGSPTKDYKSNVHALATVADDLSNPCYKFLGWVGFSNKVSSPQKKSSLTAPFVATITDSDNSTSDEELEEVVDEAGTNSVIEDEKSLVEHLLATQQVEFQKTSTVDKQPQLRIQVQLNSALKEEDDLFADVFRNADSGTSPEMENSASQNSIIENQSQDSNSSLIGFESEKQQIPAMPDTHRVYETVQPGDENNILVPANQNQSLLSDSTSNAVMCSNQEDKIHSSPKQIQKHTQLAPIFVNSKPATSNQIPSPVLFTTSTSSEGSQMSTMGSGASYANIEDEGDLIDGMEKAGPSDSKENLQMITKEYLQAQMSLNSEKKKLEMEIGAQDRTAMSLSEQIHAEAQELLALFGVPWVVSPMEAESQCAFFDTACLTEGTITDDSDVWLFGGRRVYKNFFSQGDKHIQFFQSSTIVQKLKLDREKMILLAILLGSDYTDGVEGVGPITAMEIVTEFSSPTISAFDSLVKFYEWWEMAHKNQDHIPGANKVKEKFRKLKIRPGFPSRTVFDAYLTPTLDSSLENFRWAPLQLPSLLQFAKTKFGWDEARTDSILRPLLKTSTSPTKSTQLTLDRFLTLPEGNADANSKSGKIQSKRLRRAVAKLKRGGTQQHRKAPDEVDLSCSDSLDSDSENSDSMDSSDKKFKRKISVRSNFSSTAAISSKRTKEDTAENNDTFFARRIPPVSEYIPQRVQDEADKMKSKQAAIKVFKKQK